VQSFEGNEVQGQPGQRGSDASLEQEPSVLAR
jgi:hypothetical protein